jgi:hypothetical protein
VVALYEGNFYQVPSTKGEHQVTPLKANYISLINKVNEENYDLTEAADIIGNDPALTIELLRIVNNIAVNSEVTSLRHAAAMLGQKELKRWITTAALSELCTDKPSEIMRVSMLRGKFAENLAKASGKSPIITLVMTNLLCNFLVRPDFIAYNHKYADQPSFALMRKLYKTDCAAWTVRGEKELKKAKKSFSMFIFDSFIPNK